MVSVFIFRNKALKSRIVEIGFDYRRKTPDQLIDIKR